VPYAKNALDGSRVYFEDDGGTGAPVVLHGGSLDSVATVRDLDLAQALRDEFRLIYVDHRGLGRSDKPHDTDAYEMPLRVADALAVLDELGIERAHFIGMSWGGRLGFGIGEHAPQRVLSLVIGGQQPYRWPDSPLTRLVTDGLIEARRRKAWRLSSRQWRRFGRSGFRRRRALASSTTILRLLRRHGRRGWLRSLRADLQRPWLAQRSVPDAS
jgi:pimeloyl-ACP methyl ester carboxylesterase